MTDITTMMRDAARNGLQVQLDKAVTDGDTEAARKVTADLEKLAVSTAPKAPPFGPAEIAVEMGRLDWFGTDPKKSGRAIELGKHLDPKKFATAAAFAAALVKAVDEEFKVPGVTGEPGDEEPGDELTDEEPAAVPAKKPRKTDSPGEGDALAARSARRTGPWIKLTDAPAETQKEINRTADKFAPKTKEGREGFIKRALEAHYAQHQRTTKGNK